MSRCFPFPPPGYDKKFIPEDGNVLKEERQKEKKHKKDKKNKEKREGKEKRDKERSEGKHKEKRDKKDKHKDKKDKHRNKKEKRDKGKEKEKSGSSEVTKVVRVAECNSGEKLVLKGKDNSNCLVENTYAVQFHGQNGEEPVRCNFIARGTEESKYVQELGKRFRDQEKVTSTQLERLPGAEKRRDDERERFGVSYPRNSGEEKGKSTNNEFDFRRVDDAQGHMEQTIYGEHSRARNLVGAAKRVSEIPAMVEKNDKRMEEKQQTKDKSEKRWDNHKDKDTNKKDKGKDKNREKEKKKEEKGKNKNEQKKSELDKLVDANRGNNITGGILKAISSPSEPSNKAKAELNPKKRKDLEINGFHDHEIRLTKLQRPASHPVMENGRKFEASETPGFFASDLPHFDASLKLDSKKHKKNGTIESRSFPLHKEKPSIPIVPDVIIPEPPKKHPHPDSKYLNQVLSIPEMEDWSHVVNNDWLSGSKECPFKKDEVSCVVVGEEPKVWSNTLYLESADVVALPYVVPY